jgi:tetratricopeptide (TPR) repeat protein
MNSSGEILLATKRAADALAAFTRALARHPNRALALLGRARAEAALGQVAAAVDTFRQFLEIWREADPERPELAEARDFIARHGGKGGS